MAYDVVITGGTVVDGTGDAAFQADIAIRNGKIQDIGQDLPTESANIIDATEKSLRQGS